MADRRHVKPSPGFDIKDPATGTMLEPEGKAVDWSRYWASCERAGMVTAEPVAPAKAPAPAPTNAEAPKPKRKKSTKKPSGN